MTEETRQTEAAFYGDFYPALVQAREILEREMHEYMDLRNSADFLEPVLYVSTRIKSPSSAVEKCRRKGIPHFSRLTDLLGARIICAFTADVYETAAWLRSRFRVSGLEDYYRRPKPNGYRSLHMLAAVPVPEGPDVTAEIQVRTIATDFWAALEHQIKYKRHVKDEEILVPELKNAADEIASVDLRLSTIRGLIAKGGGEPV